MTNAETLHKLIELCIKANRGLLFAEGREDEDEWNINNARDTLQEVIWDLSEMALELEKS